MAKKMKLDPSIAKILKENARGINLDIGCGANKQPGFVGMDIRKEPGVDIVQDLETQPWCLPDECVSFVVASHVLEHINPARFGFINVMNEIWRICKPGAQFAIAVPYAGSPGYWQDPTHVNPINEVTWAYFDPLDRSGLWNIYKPKPWKILKCTFQMEGFMEVLLEKRIEDKTYGKKD
jgi:SAM-dependent methyltransferase